MMMISNSVVVVGVVRYSCSQCSWSRCCRSFTSTANRSPFEILGIHHSASFTEAKRAFIKLALQHHPDMQQQQQQQQQRDDGDGAKSSDFVKIRKAFEAIHKANAKNKPLSSIVIEESNSNNDDNDETQFLWTNEQWKQWFFQETGVSISFDVAQEVANVGNHLSQGGIDRGGYWEMARSMARQKLEKKEDMVMIPSSLCGNNRPAVDETLLVGRRKRPK